MLKDKRVLIIGGLGFLGKNLYLMLKGLVSKISILSNIRLQKNDVFQNYLTDNDLIIGDITQKDLLTELIREYDVIYCFAGISGASESISNPVADVKVNLLGHLNILEACRKKNPSAHLFFPSSRLVYGKPEYLPVNEKHRLNPESIYAIHKITAESYYMLYHHIYGLKTTIFRISNPYGPYQTFGDKKYGLINWFIYKAFNSEHIEVFGTGKQKRDYIYIDDLSDLFIKSIGNTSLYGQVFNIGSGNGISIIEMVKTIQQLIPETCYSLREWPEVYKKIETGDYVTDIAMIRKVTGWQPKTTFQNGILRTVEFYRHHHEK
jgi:UDP-glucose 4-epimerase